jgi:hypothetical protein
LTVHSQKTRKRLNTEDTETTEVTENATLRRARRRMRRKKKKGETAVDPQIHPRVIIAKPKRFASANFSPNFR